jgi:hypothetical protein
MYSVAAEKAYNWASEIDKTLQADDPRFNNCVLIEDEEGSTLFFTNAFVEEHDGFYVLFSEHHELMVFSEDSVTISNHPSGSRFNGEVEEPSAPEETNLDLVLEGKILLVETDKDGNVLKEDEIDGKTVLECLLAIVSDGLKKTIEEGKL